MDAVHIFIAVSGSEADWPVEGGKMYRSAPIQGFAENSQDEEAQFVTPAFKGVFLFVWKKEM